jgi:hypothetical protein
MGLHGAAQPGRLLDLHEEELPVTQEELPAMQEVEDSASMRGKRKESWRAVIEVVSGSCCQRRRGMAIGRNGGHPYVVGVEEVMGAKLHSNGGHARKGPKCKYAGARGLACISTKALSY